MSDQPSLPPMDSVPEKASQPGMVPYERFAEVNKQLKDMRAQLAELKLVSPEASEPAGEAVSQEDIFKRMLEDPETYLVELMSKVAQRELQLMREEIELKSALRQARQKHPEFKDFESYVLQEIVSLLDEDAELDKLPWDDVLDKGFERLQQKFKSAVHKNPEQFTVDSKQEVKKAYMEGQASRKPQPMLPSFSRDDIGKMSLQEFTKNEAAINEALKNNRIR